MTNGGPGHGWLAVLGTAALAAVILVSAQFLGSTTRRTPAPGTAAPTASAETPPPASAAPRLVVERRAAARSVPITGPGRPPLPRESAGPYGSRITTGFPDVALTFDDGPDPRWTPRVLDLLAAYETKATFCVVGVNATRYPALVRRIVADGHTLCNHSWIHDMSLGTRSGAQILADMRRTDAGIRAAAPAAKISYFRQPGGAWTPAIIAAATRLGMTCLHWQVDPQDWSRPGVHDIVHTVEIGTRPGSIVLLHDAGGDRSQTIAALRSILADLRARFPLTALPPGVDSPQLFGINLPLHPGQS